MLLEVKNLSTYFHLDEGIIYAVNDVSFSIHEQETLALVGESGCGKTIVALSILKLIQPPAKIIAGEVFFKGRDILKMKSDELERIRGKEIGFIFQEPGKALNPVYTVGHQISECIRKHRGFNRYEAHKETVKLIGNVGIADPEQRYHSYPHELSGGMKQRIMIAIALSTSPSLIIADEPTTSLDVTVQAEIMDLLSSLKRSRNLSLFIISHDLRMVASMAERVLVMYTGKILEMASTKSIFTNPLHPYTKALVGSLQEIPAYHAKYSRGIPGTLPDLLNLPKGCTFHPRCELSDKACKNIFPDLKKSGKDRYCACFKVSEA